MSDGPDTDPKPTAPRKRAAKKPPTAATAADPPPTVEARILAVVADLPPIEKERRMEEGPQYRYRSIDDILPHIKTAFVNHGLVLIPSHEVADDHRYEVVNGSRVSRWRHVTLRSTFTLRSIDGQRLDPPVVTIGEGKDNSDKAMNKAMTAAEKYALIQLLNIGGAGLDPDTERPDDSGDYSPAVGGGRSRAQAQPQRGRQAPARQTATARQPRPIDHLIELRPALDNLGLRDDVRAFALDAGIELNEAAHDAEVAKVVEYAQSLIAQRFAEADTAGETEADIEDAEVVE